MARTVQVHILLPKDLVDRLDKAARACALNRTDFIKNATLAELADVEDAQRMKRLRANRVSTRAAHDEGVGPMPADDSPSPGLGLGELLGALDRHDTQGASPAGAPAGGDSIARLADAIVARLEKPAPPKADDPEKDKRTSAGILFEKLAGLLS